MNKGLNLVLIIIASIFVHLKPGIGQDTSRQEIKISLLTIGPGKSELYAIFGHSAIRVSDPENLTDLTYNYGTFDFRTPNFYPKFLRGKLPYVLSVAPTSAFLQEYLHDQRDVSEQEIILSNEDKQAMILALNENAKPENRAYMYDFFLDNCATRIRDIFLKSSASPVVLPEVEPITRRQMLHEYLGLFPWTKFGIDLIIGSRADQAIGEMDQMFLPDYMQRIFSEAVVDSAFLFEPSKELLFFNEEEHKLPGFFSTPFFIFTIVGFLILLLTFLVKRPLGFIAANAIFALLGLASIVILFMWFGTDHKATKDNLNILWISPLYIIIPFIGYKLGRIALIAAIVLALVCMTPWLGQAMPVLTLLPLMVCCAVTYLLAYPADDQA